MRIIRPHRAVACHGSGVYYLKAHAKYAGGARFESSIFVLRCDSTTWEPTAKPRVLPTDFCAASRGMFTFDGRVSVRVFSKSEEILILFAWLTFLFAVGFVLNKAPAPFNGSRNHQRRQLFQG
jgi:hypothetical protein